MIDSVTLEARSIEVHAFIMTKLDYGNTLRIVLIGLAYKCVHGLHFLVELPLIETKCRKGTLISKSGCIRVPNTCNIHIMETSTCWII